MSGTVVARATRYATSTNSEGLRSPLSGKPNVAETALPDKKRASAPTCCAASADRRSQTAGTIMPLLLSTISHAAGATVIPLSAFVAPTTRPLRLANPVSLPIRSRHSWPWDRVDRSLGRLVRMVIGRNGQARGGEALINNRKASGLV